MGSREGWEGAKKGRGQEGQALGWVMSQQGGGGLAASSLPDREGRLR